MRFHNILIILACCLLLNCSSNRDREKYAYEWTAIIKNKILEDVNIEPDSLSVDTPSSAYMQWTLYSKNRITKQIGIKILTGDTLFTRFYSTDQSFILVREICSNGTIGFEGIKYKDRHYGYADFKFCNGKISMRGFRFKTDIGNWERWNEAGVLVSKKDYGEMEKLDSLKFIKYSR